MPAGGGDGGAGGAVIDAILDEAGDRLRELAAWARRQHEAAGRGDVEAFVAATDARDELIRTLSGLEGRLGRALLPALCQGRPHEAETWRDLLLEVADLDRLTLIQATRLSAALRDEARRVHRQRENLMAYRPASAREGRPRLLDQRQ